ncbi:transketolase, partial [Rhizobium hidalgonense]|nr:transketolase [Rhizobium hidalgonense]
TQQRFEAYGWHVVKVDGHDTQAIAAATEQAKAQTTKPSLIICKTIIGLGSPNKQGKEDCHGAPLGASEIELMRDTLTWTDEPFVIPADVYAAWDGRAKGAAQEEE